MLGRQSGDASERGAASEELVENLLKLHPVPAATSHTETTVLHPAATENPGVQLQGVLWYVPDRTPVVYFGRQVSTWFQVDSKKPAKRFCAP